MPFESADCPLCKSAAERETLAFDGYYYSCPSCGKFEIGSIAFRKALAGQLPPNIPGDVRRLQAEGKLPRIEFNAPDFEVVPVDPARR
ncbi:MAG: hypothetical protein ACN6OP_25395 [Pseudomonadales bacterium]